MVDPETIRQRNIDFTNGRYAAFKASATLRGKKLQDAFAEAMDQWVGIQQKSDEKPLANSKTVRGIDPPYPTDRELNAVEEAFSHALRSADIPIQILARVQRIVEEICAAMGEASRRSNVGQTSPHQAITELEELPSATKRPRGNSKKSGKDPRATTSAK